MELSTAAATIALVLVAWLGLGLVVALFLGAIVRQRDSQPNVRQAPEAQTRSLIEAHRPANL